MSHAYDPPSPYRPEPWPEPTKLVSPEEDREILKAYKTYPQDDDDSIMASWVQTAKKQQHTIDELGKELTLRDTTVYELQAEVFDHIERSQQLMDASDTELAGKDATIQEMLRLLKRARLALNLTKGFSHGNRRSNVDALLLDITSMVDAWSVDP